MGLRQLEYQDRVLSTLDVYLHCLKEEKQESDKVAKHAASRPDLDIIIPDFAEKAWNKLRVGEKITYP